MPYRKDIQILRGISVLLIVLFHLEIAGVKSGFLGVDIFFVISGYLMALLYDRNKKLDFFVKRAKRLLPAYFVIVLLTVIGTIFLTTPNEFNQAANQSIFAIFFSSNVGYWLQNSYFSKAEFNPLLHLWSLGVEIQYYFLVPLLFWVFSKNKAFLPLILVSSIAACFIVVRISPKTSFFMTPLRLWEFLIGWTVAIYFDKIRSDKTFIQTIISSVSLIVIILVPFMNVDGEALSVVNGHPGVHALVVSLATSTILAFGIPLFFEDTRVGCLLETTGKYSYSIYLAHFPIIVLFLAEPFAGTNLKASTSGQTLALIIMVLALSLLMYRFVEAPVRLSKQISPWLLTLPCGVVLLYFFGSVCQQFLYSDKELLLFQAFTDRSCYRCGKLARLIDPLAISCETTHDIKKPSLRILLVGNSHADSIKSAFTSVAQERNVSVRFMVENNPLHGGSNPREIINEALLRQSKAIVLHFSPNSVGIPVIRELVYLAKQNDIAVALVMPVPIWKIHVPRSLWENLRFKTPMPEQSYQNYKDANETYHLELLNINCKNFRVYYVGGIFCNPRCQTVNNSGKPLYFDKQHLTLSGSELLRDLFGTIIDDMADKKMRDEEKTA